MDLDLDLDIRIDWLLKGLPRSLCLISIKFPVLLLIMLYTISGNWDKLMLIMLFLHGDLVLEVYTVQLLGLEQRDATDNVLVCRLHKAFYGLKQALRGWFEKLWNFLVNVLSFDISQSDNCLFLMTTSEGTVLVFVYMFMTLWSPKAIVMKFNMLLLLLMVNFD